MNLKRILIAIVLTIAIVTLIVTYLLKGVSEITILAPPSEKGSTYNLNYYALNSFIDDGNITGKVIVPEEGLYSERILNSLNEDSEIDIIYTVFNSSVMNLNEKVLGLQGRFNEYIPDEFLSFTSYSDNKYYYTPLTWAPWGIYYNKSIFKEYELTEPETYEDLKKISNTLLEKSITPYAMVQHYGWPITAWFDYLNIRMNGFEFHNALLAGNISFLDERVNKVYLEIYTMISGDEFYRESDKTLFWDVLVEQLDNEKSAMFLGTTFFYNNYPNQNELGWFPFPLLEKANLRSEVVTSSGYIINSNTPEKRVVKKYIKEALGESIQKSIYKNSNLIPINYNVARDLNRVDINRGYKNIDGITKLLPSFERNCNPQLLAPFKWSISSLFDISDEKEIDLILEKIEKSRKGLIIEKK